MCNDRYASKPFDLENSLISGQSSRNRVGYAQADNVSVTAGYFDSGNNQ